MKKLRVFGHSLILIALFVLILFISVVAVSSAVRINEVELNPEGSDSRNEWLELYSEQSITLNGWKLVNNDAKEISLNKSFQGYLLINFSEQWLDNSDEKIILKDRDNIIQETIILEDSFNDDRTWQYCDGDWIFASATKNSANSCSLKNQTQNNIQQNNTNQSQKQETKIYLEVEWGENEIINRKDFEIKVKSYNLKNENYDFKIYISFEDNDTLISDIYNEKENKWQSSAYYVNEILSGSGNKSKTFSLRIKEKYENLSGNAKIKVKIKKSGSSSIITEIQKDIEILESEKEIEKEGDEKELEENKTEQKDKEVNREATLTDEQTTQTSNIIRLGNRSKIQEQAKAKVENKKEQQDKSEILYESGSEKIKKYAIYSLNLILIVIIFLLLKLRKKKV